MEIHILPTGEANATNVLTLRNYKNKIEALLPKYVYLAITSNLKKYSKKKTPKS